MEPQIVNQVEPAVSQTQVRPVGARNPALAAASRLIRHNNNNNKRQRTFSVDQQRAAEQRKEPLIKSWLKQLDEPACKASHCWSANATRRGKYGESLCHVLLLCCNGQSELANEQLILLVILLELWPHLLLDVFLSRKFRGLGCLHLAVASSNERLVEHLLLVGKQHNLNSQLFEQQATGSLFASPLGQLLGETAPKAPSGATGCRFYRKRIAPSEQQAKQDFWCDRLTNWPTANGANHLLLVDHLTAATSGANKHQQVAPDTANDRQQQQTTTNNPIYLGEFALSWCVSLNLRSQYEQLVGFGCCQDKQDSADGNTCLHQLVLNRQTNWCRFLAKSGARLDLRNRLGSTPLHFAAHLGECSIFSELLELSAVEFWSYSMIKCCGYPLTQLDSIRASQDQNDATKPLTTTTRRLVSESAVLAILESSCSSDEQKAQLLSLDVIKKLLEEKWKIYARSLFYRELGLTLLHLLLLTLAISLRPGRQAITQSNSAPPADLLRALSSAGQMHLVSFQSQAE